VVNPEDFPYDAVETLIEEAESVSILSHLNPDPDTIGTALGIYTLLKVSKKRRVEVVNASKELPRHLDFLSGFEKIKTKIEYENSLIIACDCGSIHRLGFELEGRKILNIDHHRSNDLYGTINVVFPEYASASQVAFGLFKKHHTIPVKSAEAFYAALLSDTRYFTTGSVTEQVFKAAQELVELGADPGKIAYHFTQRRSLASFRILATVEVAVFAMETDDGIRISLRSKGIDVNAIAAAFGGGGHKVAAGITFQAGNLQQIIDTIIVKIQETGLNNGKKEA